MDAGGPRREFFRLLPHQAAETLLKGDKGKFFTINVPAVQSGMFASMTLSTIGMDKFHCYIQRSQNSFIDAICILTDNAQNAINLCPHVVMCLILLVDD